MKSLQAVPDKKRESPRMLVVSREPSALELLRSIVEANSWHLDVAESGLGARERLQANVSLDLFVLDLPRSDVDSLHTLRWLRRTRPDLSIIILSYPEDAKHKHEAIRLGVQDFLVRPLQRERLERAMRRHLSCSANDKDSEIASDEVEQISDDLFFVAASPTMRKLRNQIELLARVNVPVLIVGESGSGKEVAARLIHKLSVRSGFKFLKVNCAALPSELLESELFGYERGAFTGPLHTKPGKFELSDKGTLLLDEIAEMHTGLQAKLLHVLQDRQLFRLGGESSIDVDVRILAATNINVEQALAGKRLREDLYYRLSALTLHVPPLRERREEIPVLMYQFMHQLANHYGLPARSFSPAVLQSCRSYSWPGNLRELENFVKQYLVIGDEEFALSALERRKNNNGSDSQLQPATEPDPETRNSAAGLKLLLQNVKGEAERNAIAVALGETHWNRKAAARLLKVSYRTLLYKIEQHHMIPPAYAVHPPAMNGLRRRAPIVNPSTPCPQTSSR